MIKSVQTNQPSPVTKLEVQLPAVFDYYTDGPNYSDLSVLFVTEDSGVIVSSTSPLRLGKFEKQLVSCRSVNWVLSQKKFEISN